MIKIKSLKGDTLLEITPESPRQKKTYLDTAEELRLVDLSHLVLKGADLKGLNLKGINMRYANLSDSSLENSDLRNADLESINLSYVDLRGANLSRTNLLDANLRGANLVGTDLSYADLRYVDLREANLKDAILNGANLRDADLRGANLSGVNLYKAELTGVRSNQDTVWKNCTNIPLFCKWSVGMCEDEIRIGCESKTIKRWDAFFEDGSDEYIETPRDSSDFKRIHATYLALKAYKNHMDS